MNKKIEINFSGKLNPESCEWETTKSEVKIGDEIQPKFNLVCNQNEETGVYESRLETVQMASGSMIIETIKAMLKTNDQIGLGLLEKFLDKNIKPFEIEVRNKK